MRSATRELILDVTTAGLLGTASTMPLPVLAGAVGVWLKAPNTVRWTDLAAMGLLSAVVAALSVALARGVANRGRLAIVLVAVAMASTACLLAMPLFGWVPNQKGGPSAFVHPLFLVAGAVTLVVCALQRKRGPMERAQ